ncbi:MAG: pitrilysin family protein [bacterium]
MINKFKAPINPEIPDFEFPQFEKILINEDITLYAVHDDFQPLVSFTVLFPLGANSEKNAGISYFSSQMLKRGTKKRSSSQIAEEFDKLGASLNISSDWDYTKAGFTCLGNYFSDCIEILSDCIYNSNFSDDEIERLKTKHLADIEQETADPSYTADISLSKGVFGNHPYGHPMIGTKRSIKTIENIDCLSWYDELLSSEKINIVVSGTFKIEQVIKLVHKNFKVKAEENKHSKKLILFDKNIENKIIIKNKRDSEQTHLRIGKLTISRNNPDFPAYQFANTVFGGFFLSRLNKLLREELGYTYGVSSYINSKKLASISVVSTSINKDASADTVKKVLEQMNLMKNEKISEEEYILVRRYLLGSFVRGIETSRQIAGLVRNQIVAELSDDYYTNFYNRIKELTIDEIFDCQKKYFSTSGLVITAVGDKKLLEKSLDNTLF